MDETERRLDAIVRDAQSEADGISAELRGETDKAVRRRLQSRLQKAVKRRTAAAGALRKYREDKARRS